MDPKLGQQKLFLGLGFVLCGLAVGLGAFGAHGLEETLSEKALKTFHTGVDYHFIHALALILGGILLGQGFKIQTALWAFVLGMSIFSGGCYLYALTGFKIFALVVPFGGVSFLLGWFFGAYKILKKQDS